MAQSEQKVYIYQRLRTQGVKPLYLARAIEELETLSEMIFERTITLNKEELERSIGDAILAQHLSQRSTHAVEVRVFPSQEVEIVVDNAIFLEPFPLRAIRPTAVPYILSNEMLLHPTSARDALLDIYHAGAKLPSESTPMWIDHNNEIVAIEGASVVAVTDSEVIFSRFGRGVEFELAERAMAKTSHYTRRGEVLYDNITLYKEVLYIDHRGVVALASIEGRALSNIIAERIAKEVTKLEKL